MSSHPRNMAVVILAAGKGVRMKSDLPKVIHPVLGKPMVKYVIEACQKAKVDRIIIVVGHRGDLVCQTLGTTFEYVEQTKQLGTGHSLMAASSILKGYEGDVVVLAGDTPFLTGQIIRKLINYHQKIGASATFMTAIMDPPPAYGRILRDQDGRVIRIVEERDATKEEKKITEVNTSHYCFQSSKVFSLLPYLNSDNNQGEYYLTDVVQMFVQKGDLVETLTSDDSDVLVGINSRAELSNACRILQEKIIRRHLDQGVTFVDRSSVTIEPGVKIGEDVVVQPFTQIMGNTVIGRECIIGPHVKIVGAKIGDRCRVEFSVIENRKIEKGATIGPFAYISGER